MVCAINTGVQLAFGKVKRSEVKFTALSVHCQQGSAYLHDCLDFLVTCCIFSAMFVYYAHALLSD